MWKNIFKKSLRDVLRVCAIFMGILLILYSIMPFLPICTVHRLFLYEQVLNVIRCVLITAVLGGLFEYITEEFLLFSQKRWIRRGIVFSVFIILMTVNFTLAGVFSIIPSKILPLLILYLVVVGGIASFTAFLVEDKRRKKEIKDINEKLDELNREESEKGNMEWKK